MALKKKAFFGNEFTGYTTTIAAKENIRKKMVNLDHLLNQVEITSSLNKFPAHRTNTRPDEEAVDQAQIEAQIKVNRNLVNKVIEIKTGKSSTGARLGVKLSEKNLEQIRAAINQLAIFKNAADGSAEKNAWNSDFGQKDAASLDKQLHLIIENFTDNDAFLA